MRRAATLKRNRFDPFPLGFCQAGKHRPAVMQSEPQFKGWNGRTTGKLGTEVLVRVVNEGQQIGTGVKLYKVRERIYRGCQGWSGGCRPVYTLGSKAFWVKADTVTR